MFKNERALTENWHHQPSSLVVTNPVPEWLELDSPIYLFEIIFEMKSEMNGMVPL
jgi:hypothetical protein